MINPEMKCIDDLKGFNKYDKDNDTEIWKIYIEGHDFLKKNNNNDYQHYKTYSAKPLQEKIDKAIDSIQGYDSIKELLKMMLKVRIRKRIDIKALLDSAKKIFFKDHFRNYCINTF